MFNDIGQATLDNAFSGYNVCVFAYGQTGSGKSYSMVGSEEDRGIVPRVAMALFEYIERQKVCMPVCFCVPFFGAAQWHIEDRRFCAVS